MTTISAAKFAANVFQVLDTADGYTSLWFIAGLALLTAVVGYVTVVVGYVVGLAVFRATSWRAPRHASTVRRRTLKGPRG